MLSSCGIWVKLEHGAAATFLFRANTFKILVLDEATASIDNATNMILQKTIQTEFADCTVITVAHRIPTVMDCTVVLAISDGESHILLQPFSIEYSVCFCTKSSIFLWMPFVMLMLANF